MNFEYEYEILYDSEFCRDLEKKLLNILMRDGFVQVV